MIPRDRWGNPRIPSPFPHGEPVGHKRPSSITGKIDDIYNLRQWEQRMAVKGTAENPELLAMAHSLDPEDSDDRRAFGELLKRAKEAAGSLTGANRGTTMHTYVRRKLAGEDVQPLPDYAPGLDLYLQTLDLHGINPVLLEQFVVWPDKQIAGSCDLYAEYDGRTVVMDLKTGAHDPTSWSMVAYSAQLACYANATHQWDGTTATPLPDVDTDVAYLLWLPYQGGRCELIEVDVAKGAHWVDLALEIDAAHKDKTVGRHIPAPAAPAPASFRDPIRDGITRCTARIGRLLQAGVDPGDIQAHWPDGVAKLNEGPAHHTTATLDDISAQLMILEMAVGLAPAERCTVEQAMQRIADLDETVQAELDLAAKRLDPPIPNLKTKVTDADLDRLADLLDVAEKPERATLALAVYGLAPSEQRSLIDWATEPAEGIELDELDDLAGERLHGLAHLYHRRGVDRDQLLIDVLGSKAEALAAARDAAKRHGLDAPKSTADVAANRVLCGLVTDPLERA